MSALPGRSERYSHKGRLGDLARSPRPRSPPLPLLPGACCSESLPRRVVPWGGARQGPGQRSRRVSGRCPTTGTRTARVGSRLTSGGLDRWRQGLPPISGGDRGDPACGGEVQWGESTLFSPLPVQMTREGAGY
ncbi:uncharacterized protein V5649_018961 [Rhynchonycteris naso]